MSNRPRAQRRTHATTKTSPMHRAYKRLLDQVGSLPQERVGVHNVYVCPKCDAFTVTVDRDPGVTPMFLACAACGNTSAVSSGYPEAAMQLEPAWEWYRPELDQFLTLTPDARAHVLDGGLLVRPISVEVEA